MLFSSCNAHSLGRAIIYSVPLICGSCAQTALVGDDFIDFADETTEVNRLPSAEKIIGDPHSPHEIQQDLSQVDFNSSTIPEWLHGVDCDGPVGGEVFAGLDTILHGTPVPEQQIFELGPLSEVQIIPPEDGSTPALALYDETYNLLYLDMFCGDVTPGGYEIVACDPNNADCNFLCADAMRSYVGPSQFYFGMSGLVVIDETEDCLAGRFKIQYGTNRNGALSGWFRAKTMPVPVVKGNGNPDN